jgi:hypothetical protein
MDRLQASIVVLREAELAIRKLSSDAIGEGQYETASRLIGLSVRLAGLVSESAAGGVTHGLAVAGQERAQPVNGGGVRKEYPLFERRGQELVKVGWSKTDGAEYEHGAPWVLVEAIVERLDGIGGMKRCFESGTLLAVGEALSAPAYQVYVVLAWLRNLGLVEANGRKGYFLPAGRQLGAAVQAKWLELERMA